MTVAHAQAAPVSRLYQQAIRAMWLGLVINVLLAVVKLIAGLLSHSIARHLYCLRKC